MLQVEKQKRREFVNMNFNELPLEVRVLGIPQPLETDPCSLSCNNFYLFQMIWEIFGFLKPWDRRNAALVCKKWMETSYRPYFYNCAVFMGQTSIETARSRWKKEAYHPFSVVEFLSIETFPIDFDEICEDLGKTVTTLKFSYCRGLSKFLKMFRLMSLISFIFRRSIEEHLKPHAAGENSRFDK